jgi:hypothetical protein
MSNCNMATIRGTVIAVALAVCCSSAASWATDRFVSSANAQINQRPPDVITREAWGAKQALPGMKPQHVTGIILHHTGVRKSPGIAVERKMRALQEFSQNPGQVSPGHMKPSWPDVPYHFYVDAAGRIAEGRDTHFAGDTNTSYNTSGFIQVAIEGDFEQEVPTAEQIASVRALLIWLLRSRKLTAESITVHKDHAATDCPGRNFLAVLPSLLPEVKQGLASTGAKH